MREVKGKIERYFTIQKKKKTPLLPTERGLLLSKGTKNSHRATREKKKRRLPPSGEERENRPVSSRFLSNARQINARRKTSAGTQPIFPTLPREFSGYRRSILFSTFFFLMEVITARHER